MGKLNHITCAPWHKHLLGNIYASLATALRVNNAHLVRTSKRFCNALRTIHIVLQSANGNAQRSFHTGKMARSIHNCSLLHHIGHDLRHDLCLIKRILDSERIPKSCPIAHLIPQVPFGIARSDSSLDAAGRYCPAAKS